MALGIYKNEYKGFNFVSTVKRKPLNIKNETTKKTPVANETKEILIDLLEYTKTTDYKYLFVVSPYIEKEEHKERFNYISEIIKEYGHEFLDANDYYDEMQIDFSTDFCDSAHMNLLGAEKYTNFLVKYIKQYYDLPDRRGEYKDWEKLLPNWNKKINETKQEIIIQIEFQDIISEIDNIREKLNKVAEGEN